MLRNLCLIISVALAGLHATAAGAGPFASYPPAPPPDGSALGLVWQGGPTVKTADNPWQRSNLGVARVRTLESFATQLGVGLGTADDGAVFAAADTAIEAAAGAGGLVVMLPANAVEYTSVGLIGDNNGGWACPAPRACVVRMVRASASAAVTYAFQINPANPAATGVVLDGITFDGQWSWGRGAYAPNPASDPWLDTQNGVNLTVQFNGVNDAAFMAANSIGAQEPHILVKDLRIGRFGGTCLAIQGAGANEVHGVVAENCGGVGLDIDTYDSHFSDLDFGATGRQPFLCHDNCASDVFTNLKGWYGGFRQVAGATAGWDEEGGSSNIVSGLYIQDEAGDCIRRDNADLGMIHAHCQWQGAINALPPQVCALRSLAGIDSKIDLLVSLIDHAGQAYPTVNKLVCDGRSVRNTGYTGYSTRNDIHIVTEGFAQDYNLFSPTWLLGPLDTSNALWINGQMRQPAQWAPDPATGQNNYGANMLGALAGMVVFGPQSPDPGAVSIIAPGAASGALQSETTTGAYAAGALTSTQNYADGETVTVGATTYTLRATLTGAANEVRLGASEAATLANLRYAINAATPASVTAATAGGTAMTVQTIFGYAHVGDTVTCADPINCAAWIPTTIVAAPSGGRQGVYTLAAAEPAISFTNDIQVASGVIGSDYGWGTVPSFQVQATDDGAHVVTVTALALGTAGNTIPTSTTAAHAAWGAADLSGGAADTQTYVNALQWRAGGKLNAPGLQLQGHFTSDAAACAAGLRNGDFYTDTSSGRAVVYQASC